MAPILAIALGDFKSQNHHDARIRSSTWGRFSTCRVLEGRLKTCPTAKPGTYLGPFLIYLLDGEALQCS